MKKRKIGREKARKMEEKNVLNVENAVATVEKLQEIFCKKGSVEEKANFLMALVHSNGDKFFLRSLDEDERSEFFLFANRTFFHIAKSYNERKGRFFSYLRSSIFNAVLSFKREVAKKYVKEKAVFKNYCDDWTESYEENFFESFEDFAELDWRKWKGEKNFEKMVLCIALKSAYFLEDSHIEKLAKATRLDERRILQLIDEIKEETKSRAEKCEKNRQLLNVAYTKKRQYELQLEKQREEDEIDENLLDAIKRCEEKIREKREHPERFFVVPSNGEIAKVLKKTKRQVEFLMQKAKEMMGR